MAETVDQFNQRFRIPPGGLTIGQTVPTNANGGTLATGPDGRPVGNPNTTPIGQPANANRPGLFDPRQLVMDTTNPNALPIIAMIAKMFQQRQGMAGQRMPVRTGPMSQLFPPGSAMPSGPSNVPAATAVNKKFDPSTIMPKIEPGVVNSGSRMIRSFQPQYQNQYNGFDPEQFLRSL